MPSAFSEKSNPQTLEDSSRYSNTLPKRLGGITIRKVLYGPYQTDTFTIRKAVFLEPINTWLREYDRQIRELALAYWLGSEKDIAIISLPKNKGNGPSSTRIYHQFDRLTDRMLRIMFDFYWDDLSKTHLCERKVNTVRLLGCLLTHYNGVFLDDPVSDVCRLFHVVPLSREVPEILNLSDHEDTCMVFRKEEYYLKHITGTQQERGAYTKSMFITLPGLRLAPADN